MKCIEELKALAESVGAEVDKDTLESGHVAVDAPRGYVWDANGCASLYATASVRKQTFWVDACKDIVDQMRYGLSKCDPETSASIEYERDEPWTASPDAPATIKVGK